MPSKKKINPDHIVTCVECGNSDDGKMLLIDSAPWIVECMECGHPNDRTWGHADDNGFYDM